MVKSDIPTNKPRKTLYLGQEDKQLETFDLIEVQRTSWQTFINGELKTIISDFFPIDDYTGKKFTLAFEDLYFGKPRYDLELCLKKKLTYDTPVYLTLHLTNKKTGAERKQDVYFFNLP